MLTQVGIFCNKAGRAIGNEFAKLGNWFSEMAHKFKNRNNKDIQSGEDAEKLIIKPNAKKSDSIFAEVQIRQDIFDALRQNSPITELDLNPISEFIDDETLNDILDGLPKLETLKIGDCRKLTKEGIIRITGIENLKNLDLEESSINDDGLIYLTVLKKLENINLTNCPNITARGVGYLRSLENLKIKCKFASEQKSSQVTILAETKEKKHEGKAGKINITIQADNLETNPDFSAKSPISLHLEKSYRDQLSPIDRTPTPSVFLPLSLDPSDSKMQPNRSPLPSPSSKVVPVIANQGNIKGKTLEIPS